MIGYAGYIAIRGLGLFVRALPLGTALAVGRGIGSFWYHIVRVRRRVVLANLRHVFGDRKTDAQIRKLALRSYQHFMMNVVEVLRSVGVRPASFQNRTHIEGLEALLEIQRRNEPLIICSAHMGNFDLLGYSTGASGARLTVIARPVKNPWFHRLIMGTREQFGVRVLMKGSDAFLELFDLLDEGETIVLLPDQNARTHGTIVDFLGQPASTFKGPAVLHLVSGVQLAVIVDRRSAPDPRRHSARLQFLAPIEPTGRRDEDIRAITQQLNDTISAEVLQQPEQYFWLHRRWGRL